MRGRLLEPTSRARNNCGGIEHGAEHDDNPEAARIPRPKCMALERKRSVENKDDAAGETTEW